MHNKNPHELKREIELFKAQIKEVNSAIALYENDLKHLKDKVTIVRESFANLIKLMNHELIDILTETNNSIKKFNSLK
jgi:hypothetical protein